MPTSGRCNHMQTSASRPSEPRDHQPSARKPIVISCVVVAAFAVAGWAIWPDSWGPGGGPDKGPGASRSTTSATAEFPTRESVGLPEGWQPRREVSGTYQVTTPGAVVEDLRITNGTIEVSAPDVTLRRVELVGSRITNTTGDGCATGMVIEESDIVAGVGVMSVVGAGSYSVRNVAIDGVSEGLRVGGVSSGCGAVTVDQTYIRIVSPTPCGDWHGDGIQGYDGGRLTVRDTTIVFDERPDCGGTAPFFYPDNQGNSGPVDIDGLLVQGGGYPFRLGMPGVVRNLAVVDGSWGYHPIEVNCTLVTEWQAQIVTLDRSGQPRPVRPLACD